MNWLDGLLIIILLLSLWEGYGQSFLAELNYFLSFVLAFILALKFYGLAASGLTQVGLPVALAKVIGFILVWFIIENLLLITLRLLTVRLPSLEKYKAWLRPLAMLFSLSRGLVLIVILLIVVQNLPLVPTVKLAINQSKIAGFLLVKSQQLEAPLKSVFGDLSQDTINFLTIKPKSDERVSLGYQTTDFEPVPSLEQQMIALVNRERTSRGLPALAYEAKLEPLGRSHSADMFKRGYFSHYSPENQNVADRARQYQVDYSIIGENLAYAPSLELAHNGLMNSPGHRANILSPDYQKIAIGIMDGGAYGLMVTQVFLTE